MADPVTNNYNLTLPTVGGDTATWGGIQNTQIFSPLDSILGSNLGVTITSADVTLTNTQFQNATFTVSGTLTGNRNLIIPLSPNSTSAVVGGNFVVANNSSGAFSINVKGGSSNSGPGVVVPQGFAAQLYSDGSNIFYANNGLIGYAAASNGNPSTSIAGTAASINTNATLAVDYTTGLLYVCTTSGPAGSATYTPTAGFLGFDTPQNLTLSCSVTSNILTVNAFAANTGVAPTAGNPITFRFRDVTLANGDPVQVQATSALNITTNAVGASLGSSSGNVPFRFWIVVFNNGGVPVLGLINCSTSKSILSIPEYGLASSTQMSSAATTAGVFYTPNGTTLTNKAFRIIGLLSYESGLVTAGTYNNPPTVVQLFGPGIKLPGDTVQLAVNSTTSSTAIGTNTQTSLSASITPTSAVNPVMVKADVNWQSGTAQNEYSIAQLSRGTGPTYIGNKYFAGQNANTQFSQAIAVQLQAFDLPGTTSATTYYVYMTVSQGAATFNNSAFPLFMYLEEIMG